ncbi:MAG: hypothetical protein LBL13_03600, partial [Bacteroidales bacterium]|nr:hypothetical protein [Bacteroidales bacterium]
GLQRYHFFFSYSIGKRCKGGRDERAKGRRDEREQGTRDKGQGVPRGVHSVGMQKEYIHFFFYREIFPNGN